MKRRIVQKLLRLYPQKWRDEYGAEFEDVLFVEPLKLAVVLNVILNAMRQQVHIPNHPASSVGFLAFILRLGFGFGAILCGIRAMGYWMILQVGSVPQTESGGIALVVYRSVFLFVTLSLACAYLRERTSGARAVVVRALYLTGAHGLPSLVLFTVVSKGAILQMPEVVGLLLLFICFVLMLRSPGPKHND